MISLSCAICNKSQKIVELYPQTINFENVDKETFSARRTPDRSHYRLVKCLKCGLIFSNPILDPNKIERLYEESSFIYSDESKYLKKTYRHYLEGAFHQLGIEKFRKLKLLEIGCGNGFFLEEVKNNLGIKSVYGVEPSKSSVKFSAKSIKNKINAGILTSTLFKNNTFDIICCFHTLDHVIDPNKFLRICFKFLKKDGMILFIVHNTNGLSVKLFGEGSAIFDIEHIYLFNPKNLSIIFKKNGFIVIDTFDVKNKYPLNYWFRMVPLPAFLKYILLKILKVTKIGNIPLSINAGNIGILAKKL